MDTDAKRKGAMSRRCIVVIAVILLVLTMIGTADAQILENADTPARANYASLQWERSLGSGYTNAPTPPLVSGGCVYVHAGSTVYKLDKETGKTQGSCVVGMTPGYATLPMITGEEDDSGYVYAFGNDAARKTSRVFKIDKETMTVVGESALFPGQNINPLQYRNGRIYGATWELTADGTTVSPGTYFCLQADTMETIWTFQKWKDEAAEEGNGGYYWNGAYVTGDDRYAVFGSYGTLSGGTHHSVIYAVAAASGGTAAAETDELALDEQVTSSVAGQGGYIYFATKGGHLYKVPFDSSSGTFGTPQTASLRGESVSTPILYENRLYVASAGEIAVFDTSGENLVKIDSTAITAPIKGEMLYAVKANCLYGGLYQGGSLWFAKMDADGKITDAGNLFTPSHVQYGGYAVAGDEDGRLYFKNDSGYLMCVKAGYDRSAPQLTAAASAGYKSIRLTWTKKNNIVAYQIRRSDGKTFTASASAASFTDTSVTTGRRYSYTIRALCGESTYSAHSAAKAAKAVPAGPKITTKAGRKKITISWKKVAGARGYQVYRAVKKQGSYKKVTTTRSRSWINKGCKRGKTYYYKVRAYTKVQGKTVYGSWSSVSGRKAK